MYKKILVPIDGSATSQRGLAEAIKLAKLTQGSIRLFHAVNDLPFVTGAEGYGMLMGDIQKTLREAGEKMLAKNRDAVAQAGVSVDTVLLDDLNNRLWEQIADQAKEWQADLIVLGTHGRRGVGRMLLGSDAEQVVRTSVVPVLLIRNSEAAAQ